MFEKFTIVIVYSYSLIEEGKVIVFGIGDEHQSGIL